MSQDFMDILRKKKSLDITDFTAETEEDTDEGIRQLTPKQVEARDKRQSEKEAEESEQAARQSEAAKERADALATTVTMWTEILERFSRTADVTDSDMRGTMLEFSKSYLIPRTRSKEKIDNFYQSIIQKTAPNNLLELFFRDAEDLGITISGDTDAFDTQVEKTYNGKESLEILREFFEAAADMPRGLLTGKKMTRGALDKVTSMLEKTEEIDIDNLPENPDILLTKMREILLTLDRIKELQESTLTKSLDAEDENWKFALGREVDADVVDIGGVMFPQRIDESTQEGKKIYEQQLEIFDNYRSIAAEIPTLIDKVEEILEMVLNMRNNEVEETKVAVLDKTHQKMKKLISVTVGKYKFKLEDNKTRAININ